MKPHLPLIAAAILLAVPSPAATQTDIPGPPGSGEFGRTVTALPNGNFLVTDPSFDQLSPLIENIGAVYLYNPDGLLISTLHGSTADDKVGASGVTVLANGNYVVRSPNWDNASAYEAGAVTWGSSTAGFIGGASVVVSPANSLVGSTSDDQVGSLAVTILTNGNYVVRTSLWDNGTIVDAGAATWGNGITGITGTVSPANSLVGTTPGDTVGSSDVTTLTNGNYVVRSPYWDNTSPAAIDAGAATWGDGSTGISGPVSAANSLVGSSPDDLVSRSGVIALTNGNYVIRSSNWDNTASTVANVGAVTWGNGFTGITGTVSPANSLVGTALGDTVGGYGVTALTNGHYVVSSPNWNNGSIVNAGAVTWGDGSTGISGPVSAANSLVGSSASNQVGSNFVTALTNGNYVIASPNWDNTAPAATDVGAVTWGNGFTGITGTVSFTNSIIGHSYEDQVGSSGIMPLSNGNYVVSSPNWDNTAPAVYNAGAATWGNGTKGITGIVSPANSLVGSSPDHQVGSSGIIALTNGNYVVSSKEWYSSTPNAYRVGAVTWGNGSTGIKGVVSPSNSLVGSSHVDLVGDSVTALTNGNYVVQSPLWDNTVSATDDVGAVTWGNGTTGISGPVSSINSLVGSAPGDSVGSFGVTALTNGNYVVSTFTWDNTATTAQEAGAITWGNGQTGITGPVSPANSLVGSLPDDKLGTWGRTSALANGNYIVRSPDWDNTAAAAPDADAISLGNGQTGTTGLISGTNSILGSVTSEGFSLFSAYDPARNQLIVGHRLANLVTLFRGDQLRSLAKTGQSAPGAVDIAYAKPGTAAVNPLGITLADFSLTGSGSSSGRSRALFALSPTTGTDLVLQTGTPISSLGGGLPPNTTATALLSQLFHQPNRGLFQATIKGTGITTANNRLLLLDNGLNVQLLHRTGTPIPALANATISTFTEVLQNHDQDFITVAYKLKPGGTVTAASDEGLLFLYHNGTVAANIAVREGQPGFGIGGTFGAFTGRAASALGDTIFFTALFKPTGASPIPAVHSTNLSGTTKALLVASDASAPNSNGATFGTFPAITHQSGSAIVRATLKGSPVSQNEGLYSLPTNVFLSRTLLTRKGDSIGGGLNIARILRFWPAGPDQLILQVQVSGTNVNTTNNQVLVLRQSDGTYLTLLRTGTPAPGTGPAKLVAISAIDVNPVTGLYAALGTLNGSPSSSNQALWTGDPKLGNDTTLQILRLPQLTLRKGNPYSTESTPSGIIRSIALKPAIDPTGAGGRGLAQALGANGDLALFITTDRNLIELVLLDR